MTVRLKVFKGADLVATRDLEGPITKIGKLASCHVKLDDEAISRMHAVIEETKEGAVVIDLGSTQGTLVNGKKVTKARLQPGDEIGIGKFRLVVAADGPEAKDELADIGARLAAVRDEARALVAKGRDAEAVELVCRRAGLGREEAMAYVAGLG